MLKMVGDLKIVVHKVHNNIHCLSSHLKIYQQEVWWLISNFQAFNITVVPRMCNATANSMGNVASRMSPIRDKFTIEIFYTPSILDNITNLSVFNDDEQIMHFIGNVDTFKDAVVD